MRHRTKWGKKQKRRAINSECVSSGDARGGGQGGGGKCPPKLFSAPPPPILPPPVLDNFCRNY